MDQANMGLRDPPAGEYTFELTVTDGSGNIDTDVMTLTVLPGTN